MRSRAQIARQYLEESKPDVILGGGEDARADGRRLLGLFANEEVFQQRPEGEGDVYEPSVPLDEMTAKALDVLRAPAGRRAGRCFVVAARPYGRVAPTACSRSPWPLEDTTCS